MTDTPEDLICQKKIAFELGAKYQIENRYEAPGGVAANVAQGLGKLGIEVGCYARIGDDTLGQWIKEEIGSAGVDTSLIRRSEGCISDLSAIIVDEKSGDRTIFFNRDASENLEIKKDDFENIEWIFLSALNGNEKNSWEKNMDDIIEASRELGIGIALNPGQKNIKDNVEKVTEGIKASKVLILNKDEAIEIIKNTKQKTLDTKQLNDEIYLIKELKNLGPETVALTDGIRGAWAYDGKNIYFSDSTEDKPIDSTGGGDAFSSGFLAACFKNQAAKVCLQWGIANGGSVVKYFGAKKGLLTAEEIINKINNIKVVILD